MAENPPVFFETLLPVLAQISTIMAGATYGVPMLCLPMERDQPINAERVAHPRYSVPSSTPRLRSMRSGG